MIDVLIIILAGAAGFGTALAVLMVRRDHKHEEETKAIARQAAERAAREVLTGLRPQ